MMQASVRGGFALFATIGLPILLLLALGEPMQRAVAAHEDLHERRRAGEADYFPPGPVPVAAIDGIRVEALPRMHGEQRHERWLAGLGRGLLQGWSVAACAALFPALERLQRLVLPVFAQRLERRAESLLRNRIERHNSFDIGLLQYADPLSPRFRLLACERLKTAPVPASRR